MGYSNDILANNPSLVEAMPVTNTLLVVSNGVAVVQAEPAVSFRGGDFSNLALWDWHDSIVVESNGTACVVNPNGKNARIVQTIAVSPFRQYHISVRIKTQNFPGAPQVLVNDPAGNSMDFNDLGVAQTQDWQTHHVVFNSQTNTQVTVYFGCWGGTTGILWWDDALIEEIAFLNLVRRSGTPLTVNVDGGSQLVEGTDFQTLGDSKMGTTPVNGSYDIYHTPPSLQTSGKTNGTRLRASWYHAQTVNNGQAMICPSEPATTNLLWDQAQRMVAAWGAKGYMMEFDEIREFNWCGACQQRHMDAGALLAATVQTCTTILRTVNPGGDIYTWSDMFDPNHNAHANYYLVRGNRQILAGYYDSTAGQITNWLNSAKSYSGVLGVMYTTWLNDYSVLESFGGCVSDFEIHNSWQLGGAWQTNGLQIELPTMSNHVYTVQVSTNLASWQTWSNFTATADLSWCLIPSSIQTNQPRAFFRLQTAP